MKLFMNQFSLSLLSRFSPNHWNQYLKFLLRHLSRRKNRRRILELSLLLIIQIRLLCYPPKWILWS